MSTFIMGGGGEVPPFSSPKKPSCASVDREVFVELRAGLRIYLL